MQVPEGPFRAMGDDPTVMRPMEIPEKTVNVYSLRTGVYHRKMEVLMGKP